MHEGAVPWQEGKGGCLVCCASGRTDRVGVLGAVSWQEGGCSSWTHQCCWHMLSPLWCWGTIRIRGTEVSVCPEGPSWKRLTWMQTPGWGQPHQRRRHKMGNGRVWNGAGLEMVAVLPMGPSQGIQYLLRAGPAAHLDPPCATTGTGADEEISLAQSQSGEQGLARDRATRASWEARGEMGAARVALAWQWERDRTGSGGNSLCMERRHPKAACTVSISPAAFSHIQKRCVGSIHALECPMAAG